MSIFNQTYENLLEDGHIEVDNIEYLFAIIRKLNETQAPYHIQYRYNFWCHGDAWLIKLIR